MSGNSNAKTRLKAVIIKYTCDPVLIYTVIVMMSIMYHYAGIFTLVFGLVSIVICALLFRLFNYMMSKKVIGTVCYLSVICGFLLGIRFFASAGRINYPLSFGVWFITPQAAVDFNAWYTIAVFLIFMIFMNSVIYYFTRVRYRIFMQFLIMMIPFAIYGKEAETMPIVFIIMMSVGYILLMVYFRQLKDSDAVAVCDRRETWKSVGIYAVIFASAAAFIPKPKVEADRTALETLISAESFTDRLVSMLSVFRDTSSGGQYRNVDNNTPLYYGLADEELHLKTATFSTYSYAGDSWHTEEYDVKSNGVYDNAPVNIAGTGKLTEAIMLAASLDEDFAERYGLSEFVGEKLYIPDKNEVTLYSVYDRTMYAPVPQFAEQLVETSSKEEMNVIETGLIQAQRKFERFSVFKFQYSENTFFNDDINKKIIDAIAASDYGELLIDASYVFENGGGDMEEYADFLYDEYRRFRSYGLLMEYGENERIYELAMEITDGMESDYDKAKAIEMYFLQNGFVYDLNYVKSRSENAESFLFNTKRGVCFEYATAMVLLARAAGIPARYCEGYLMSEPYENDEFDANFVITPKTAHAFPELYIKGFGWMYFEPTIARSEDSGKKITLAETLMIAGIIILAVLFMVLTFTKLYPIISNKLFVSVYGRKEPNKVITTSMLRICRIYGISGVYTSHEAASKIKEVSGADIFALAVLFDKAIYGEAILNIKDRENALNAYVSAYRAFREIRKKRRITTRKV